MQSLVHAAMFAALTAAGAFFAIPISMVPITLQDLFTALAGLLLGARVGALSQITYVLVGLAGLPVFAGGKAGLGVLLGPTGGYLIGFVLGAFTIGKLAELRRHPSVWWLFASALAGHVVIYGAGITWLSFIAHISLKKAAIVGLLPFLPGDFLKCILAAIVARKIKSQWQVRINNEP
ncbi:MAG: biotin transporter BioY [Syntrophorhabdales bacterium]